MRRKLLALLALSISLTACAIDEEAQIETERADKQTPVAEKDEDLELYEILDFVQNRRKDRTRNYRLEYTSTYYLEGEESLVDDVDFIDLEPDLLGGEFNINQRDRVYYYQDGRGQFKAILYRLEDGERKKKIISYDKNLYLFYDSEMMDDEEEESIEDVWEAVYTEDYDLEKSGFFLAKSKEEFEEKALYYHLDYPANPLDDMVDLLGIYQDSDSYKIRRLVDEEDEDSYVLKLLAHEEDLYIKFFIDKYDLYIKSYEGHNGNATFSGKLLNIDEYVDYDWDFFRHPNVL